MQSCPKSCNLCGEAPPCEDTFAEDKCKEWSGLGFCDQPKIAEDCKKTCGGCDGKVAANLDSSADYGTLQGGPDMVVMGHEHWEWGSTPALKGAAKKQKERTLPAPKEAPAPKSMALRQVQAPQAVLLVLMGSVLMHSR